MSIFNYSLIVEMCSSVGLYIKALVVETGLKQLI